jgi:hypothetical protein
MDNILQQHVNPTTAAIVMLFTLPVLAFTVMGILKLIYLYLKKKEDKLAEQITT